MALLTASLACKEENAAPGEPSGIAKLDSIPIDSLDELQEDTLIPFHSVYNFDSFKVALFTGELAAPDFKTSPFSNDPEYVKFIRTGCEKNGVNFGGHYTIIERSCGMMCLHFFIIDRLSGRIFTETKPNDGRWGYLYKPDSGLMIANAYAFTDSTRQFYSNEYVKPQLYLWKGKDFSLLTE